MKYTYIISIILSSFFTYKSASANIYPQQYAFFIPGGAFQQNQDVQDIRLMRPRYAPTEDENQEASSSQRESYIPSQTNKATTSQRKTSASQTTRDTSQATLSSKKKSTLPIAQKNTIQKIKNAPQNISKQSSPSTNIVFQEEDNESKSISPEISKKLEQYQLDENTQIATPKEAPTPQPKLSHIEELKQKSLTTLLNEIPYPDSSQPKFKQLYSSYGMELRVYQRRGKFPSNYEQEETLAKANSIKRFEVK